MAIAGFVTFENIRVGSITSTCLCSSFGDMRTYSAPILLPSSLGALPGQRFTTSGAAGAANNGAARQRRTTNNICDQAVHAQKNTAGPVKMLKRGVVIRPNNERVQRVSDFAETGRNSCLLIK